MPDPSARLDEALDERRVALGLQWNDVARLAKISLKTLDRIRKGGGTKLTRRAVEHALRLAPGSIESAIEGAPIPEPASPESVPIARGLDSVTEDELEAALAIKRAVLSQLWPPEEVERRMKQELHEIDAARAARDRQRRSAG